VVEAGEDELAVASRDARDVVDEGAGRRAEPEAGRLGLEFLEQVVEPGLGLASVRWRVGAVGPGGDLVCDAAQDFEVPFDAAGRPFAVPVRRQRRVEFLEDRVWAPLFAAAA
jgi:hypothetical protein